MGFQLRCFEHMINGNILSKCHGRQGDFWFNILQMPCATYRSYILGNGSRG